MESKLIFQYTLKEMERGQGFFDDGSLRIDFETTNDSNPLSDLLKAMISIVQTPSHLWDEENSAVIEWYCESYILLIDISSADGKMLNINITKTAGPFGEEIETQSINEEILLTDFYLIIIKELDQLIKAKGLLNYIQMWKQDEFPLTYFLTLKKYLINWKIWIPDTVDSDILESEFMMILA